MQSAEDRREMACPLNGEDCIGGVRKDFKEGSNGQKRTCRWWVHMYGKDPQTEKIYDQYDCSLPWLTVTTVEGSQMTTHVTATMQAFRNEMNEKVHKFNIGIARAASALEMMVKQQRELIEGVPLPSIENKENNGHDN